MKLSDFNTNLMTTKVVFNEEHVRPGAIISIYKIDASATGNSPTRFVRNGVVLEPTSSMIKYSYYDTSNEEMAIAYLYSSEILVPPATEVQWEDKESLYVFKIVAEQEGS